MSDNCNPESCVMNPEIARILAVVETNTNEQAKSQEKWDKLHDAVIEQTMTMQHVAETVKTDHAKNEKEHDELFSKSNANTLAVALKADKDKVTESLNSKIGTKGVVVVTAVIGTLILIMGFVIKMIA